MSRQSKDSGEQPFSDSTVQCDEWEVKRLTQQMSGYYDDVPTVDMQLDQLPVNPSPSQVQSSNPPITDPHAEGATSCPPPRSAPSELPPRPDRAAGVPLRWLYVVALLAAVGAYLLAWGAY